MSFFTLISPIFEKHKSKFSRLALLLKHFFEIKIQPNMSEQEKKKTKNLIWLTLKPSQSFFVYCIQSKENFFYRKRS